MTDDQVRLAKLEAEADKLRTKIEARALAQTRPNARTLARLVGSKIRTARDTKGMTGVALAEACGMDPGNLCRIESGTRLCRLDILVAVARVLEVSFADLLP